MNSGISVVVQGQIVPETLELLTNIKTSEVFDEVIISCWDDCKIEANVNLVRSKKPLNHGIGNRNLQITSSLAGLLQTSGKVCVKLRADQIISVESLKLMSEFYDESGDNVCVAGIFQPYPFHPRDHIFWGPRHKLIEIFNIPLASCQHISNPDYNKNTRAETYIGAHYASKFDQRISEFLDNPELFLADGGHKRNEAMLISDVLTPQIFKPFPRIKFSWPKHFLREYHYHVTQQMGEYWNEEEKWKR